MPWTPEMTNSCFHRLLKLGAPCCSFRPGFLQRDPAGAQHTAQTGRVSRVC